MNDFFQNWSENSKYRAGIQLAIYSFLVFIVFIFLVVAVKKNNFNSSNTGNNNQEEESILLEIPADYSYKINISINDVVYDINGEKVNDSHVFTKIYDSKNINYKILDSDFYRLDKEKDVLVSENEIFGDVPYSYLTPDEINKYLQISKLYDDGYRVYLKDLIYGNETDKYILFVRNENKVTIDYSELLKIFNNKIEKCNIIFEYERKE